jgi:hypothetical protein
MDSTAAVGTSLLFARQDHIHPSDTSRAAANTVVRYDTAQALTAAQQQQARQNIFAAPFDAMAYNGLQINGGMEVSQERGTAAISSTGFYICDGWKHGFVGTMGVSSSQAASVGGPFVALGFPYVLIVAVSTAQAALGAGDYLFIYQPIEGFRIARLAWGTANAQPLTIGFWSSHHRPGLYSGSIRNSVSGTPNRSYTFTYTHSVADVPQYNTVTIPGDTTGTWAVDNSAGILLTFSMGCGATFTAPSANAWLAGNYQAAPGQINAVAATSDIFRITGVTVHPGNEGPSAARSPFIIRPYPQELVWCQRYWQLVYPEARWSATTGSVWMIYVHMLSVEMRGLPTIAQLAPGISGNASAFTLNALSGRELRVQLTSAAAGDCYCMQRTFSLDARL